MPKFDIKDNAFREAFSQYSKRNDGGVSDDISDIVSRYNNLTFFQKLFNTADRKALVNEFNEIKANRKSELQYAGFVLDDKGEVTKMPENSVPGVSGTTRGEYVSSADLAASQPATDGTYVSAADLGENRDTTAQPSASEIYSSAALVKTPSRGAAARGDKVEYEQLPAAPLPEERKDHDRKVKEAKTPTNAAAPVNYSQLPNMDLNQHSPAQDPSIVARTAAGPLTREDAKHVQKVAAGPAAPTAEQLQAAQAQMAGGSPTNQYQSLKDLPLKSKSGSAKHQSLDDVPPPAAGPAAPPPVAAGPTAEQLQQAAQAMAAAPLPPPIAGAVAAGPQTQAAAEQGGQSKPPRRPLPPLPDSQPQVAAGSAAGLKGTTSRVAALKAKLGFEKQGSGKGGNSR